MIYADTSALMKLVREEPESHGLRAWLVASGAPDHESVVTNVVGVVELARAATRVGPGTVSAAVHLVARLDKLPLSATAVALASGIPPPRVRTLDALHIASAAELTELSALVTYDDRMVQAASDYGLPVVSPG